MIPSWDLNRIDLLFFVMPRIIFSFIMSAVVIPISIFGSDIYIPKGFEHGEVVDQIILISDVDGVVRDNVQAAVDPRVIESVKNLMAAGDVDVTFLSGTPIYNDLSVDLWRRGNVALDDAFGPAFMEEQSQDRVTILGIFGGQKLAPDGTLEILDQFPLEMAFEGCFLMTHAFLQEVILHGASDQQSVALVLQAELNSLPLRDPSQSILVTPNEFAEIASAIREQIDPHFRLMYNSCAIEIQMSPQWAVLDVLQSLEWEVNQPHRMLSSLSPSARQIVSGGAKRDGADFNFILLSKSHKGIASSERIACKSQDYSRALIVTIGDSQGDFPMHRNSHLGFHVGREKVWSANDLAQCIMVRDQEGKDGQFVEGTLKVLELLREGLGKSFFDLKYIPRCDACGSWRYYSLRDLGYS